MLTPPGTPFDVADKIMRGLHGRGGRDVTKNKESTIDGLRLMKKANRNSVKIDLDSLEEKTHTIRFYGDGGRWKLMNPEFGWLVEVFYDDEDHVLQIVAGGIVLFEEENSQ